MNLPQTLAEGGDGSAAQAPGRFVVSNAAFAGAADESKDGDWDCGQGWLGNEEDVGWQVGEVCVFFDDIGEVEIVEGIDFGWGEIGIPLVPEAVAVTEIVELGNERGCHEGADAGAGEMVFGQGADEGIDAVDVGIDGRQFLLKSNVGGDVCEGGDLWEAVGGAERVVVG